jgi:murein DD-endopeptidase MepM/ murein hydrolase activator NlpD
VIKSALDAKQLLDTSPAAPWNLPPASFDPSTTLASLNANQISSQLKQNLLMRTIPRGVPLSDESRVNSVFGLRLHPIQHLLRAHSGIDLKARRGTPVFTTASGVITAADANGRSSYGRYIVVQHRLGFSTLYAHLNEVHVDVGDEVVARQLLGLSGNSGRSNGPHLHYEIRYLDKPIDPQGFMKWNSDAHESIFGAKKSWPWTQINKRS